MKLALQSISNSEKSGRVLEGKVAIITGAGSGVGRATANLFAKNGSAVVVVDLLPDRVDEVVAEIKSSGGKATGMVVDLSARTEVDRMVDETLKSSGRVDILHNNAGIMDAVRPVADTPDEVWERVMHINLNAPFRASRRVIPSMLKQGGGVIVNTSP